MSRRSTRDAVIVGGGVVGAACALALTDAGLSVALVEGREPARWRADQPDLRVYAFAADNVALLDSLGVWNAVRTARVQPYRRMRVWDAAGGGELGFDADTLGREQLGWIIENDVLVDRVWAAVHASGIEVHCPARVVELEQDATSVRLRLEDGSRLEAAMAIAADGAASTLRELAGLPVSRHAYAQRGVVAFVETEQPHQATAWQRFLTTGPLAFCHSPRGAVRSCGPCRMPGRACAFAGRCGLFARVDPGLCRPSGRSARGVGAHRLPLQRQLVQQYVSGPVLTLGDAAHVVHPLAGQGVNLGLRDVAALRQTVREAIAKRAEWAAPHRLQRWARTRRSENTVAAYGFDAINTVFSNDQMHLTLLRGSVLGLAGKLPPLVDMLWKRASGGA